MKSTITRIITLVLIVGLFVWGMLFFRNLLSIPDNAPTTAIKIEVEQGDGVFEIGKKLEKEKVLNTSWSLVYQNFVSSQSVLPGIYTIKPQSTVEEVWSQIKDQAGEIKKSQLSTKNRKTVTVTIPEGSNVDKIKILLDKAGLSETFDFLLKAKSSTLPSFENYTFLPKPLTCNYGDLTNCQKYYLEGYLYPDTYELYTDSTSEEVIKKMLDGFNQKVWKTFSKKPSLETLNETIVKASIVEKETGRPGGITSINSSDLAKERALVAGVIDNRIESGIRIQSDPTIYYGTSKVVCQSGRNIPDCVGIDDSEFETMYNTYQKLGLPIGPITSPSIDTIKSILSPEVSNYLFFVADITGKKYFAITNDEHNANIEKVIQINGLLK
jgi:UPF0755 protein